MAQRRAQQHTPEPFDYAGQWTEDEATDLALPSGKRVRVKMPDVLDMARHGLIPDHLTPLVEKFIYERDAIVPKPGQARKPGERLASAVEMSRYIDVVCVGACVQPRVVFGEPTAPGEVSVERLSLGDRNAIYEWTVGVVAPLATFPGDAGGAAGSLPPVDPEPGSAAAPERPAGTGPAA